MFYSARHVTISTARVHTPTSAHAADTSDEVAVYEKGGYFVTVQVPCDVELVMYQQHW